MNTRPDMKPHSDPFGVDYLQERIDGEFALAKHIGIIVDAADDAGVILRAPLAPNANYKGSAFGGSLYSVAVLAGWAWVTRYLSARAIDADAVIQQSEMHYLVPVQAELRAAALPPPRAQTEKLTKMLARAGRGRIRLRVDMHDGATFTAYFEGVFAAATRKREL